MQIQMPEKKMGFFSWFTKDTQRSISNQYSRRPTFTVYMHGIAPDGTPVTYREDNYEGYGVFGGKCYYELLSEMNMWGYGDDVMDHHIRGVMIGSDCRVYPILTESPEWPIERSAFQTRCKPCPYQGFFYPEHNQVEHCKRWLNVEEKFVDSFHIRGFLLQPTHLLGAVWQLAHWTHSKDGMKRAFFVPCHEALPNLDAPPVVLWKHEHSGNFQYPHYRPLQRVPLLHSLVRDLEENFLYYEHPVRMNHVAATHLCNDDDEIGPHSDNNVQYVRPDTPVTFVWLGEPRELQFFTLDGKYKDSVVLHSGDAFILGQRTNVAYKHAIVSVDKEIEISRVLPVKPSVLLEMRDVCTPILWTDVRDRIATEQVRKRARHNGEDNT